MRLFKWLTIPTGDTRDVQACQTWSVRWTSRHGRYNADTRPEAEFFTSEQDAEDFAQSLRDAFNLVRHTSDTSVKVSKNTT